jgi:hypothetical protein
MFRFAIMMALVSVAGADVSLPRPAGKTSKWEGDWRDGENQIHIELRGDALFATGHAIWRGYGDNIHEGQIAGRAQHAQQKGDSLVVQDDDNFMCRITLRRVGESLLVSEFERGQFHCGGRNVSFDGTYRRMAKR